MDAHPCPFCLKLKALNDLPDDELVWQFPHSIVLLGPWQFYRGYCMLVSQLHATELSQLPDPDRIGYFEDLCRLARAMEACFQPHKLNYELLGNQVGHLHWHVFPRYRSDPEHLKPVWLRLERTEHDELERSRCLADPAARGSTAAALRQALNSMRAVQT